jgi:MoxR-like ATPase
MNEDRWYEDWQRRRREEPAPPGFADRVLAAAAADRVAADKAAAGDAAKRTALAAALLALLNSRLSRIGLCSLAAAACLFRLAHVVAIFVAY